MLSQMIIVNPCVVECPIFSHTFHGRPLLAPVSSVELRNHQPCRKTQGDKKVLLVLVLLAVVCQAAGGLLFWGSSKVVHPTLPPLKDEKQVGVWTSSLDSNTLQNGSNKVFVVVHFLLA